MNRMWRGLGLLVALTAAACSDGGMGPMGPSEVPTTVRSFDGTGGSMTVTTGATITTDKADYYPGEIVIMSGSGWEPGETVVLTLTEEPLTDGIHQFTVIADENGNILYAGFSPGAQHLGATFTLVATGQTSGRTATTVFTDGNIQVASQAGSTFTVSYRVYVGPNSTTCSNGTPALQTKAITTTPTTLDGANDNQSIRIIAPPANNEGGTFNGWLNPGDLVLTHGALSDASICAQGFTAGAGNPPKVLIATYTASPPDNTNPTVIAGGNETINEGDTFSRNGSFTDPDATNTWSATVDYGEGVGAIALPLAADKTFSLSNLYEQDGAYTVTVCVLDNVGGSHCPTFLVTVNNVAPNVDAGDDLTGADALDEGDTFMRTVTFTDPGADADWHVTIDYGDGSPGASFDVGVKSFDVSHVYPQDGSFTLEVCVEDDHDKGCDQVSITVNNVAPTITSMDVGSNGPLPVTALILVTGTFTDPGLVDDHTLTLDCNGGSASADAIPLGVRAFSGTCTFNAAGVYQIKATITDDDASDWRTSDYIVVYDPSAGFVTGGGWIDSPSTACPVGSACEGVTGKANFGFVSKYLKGANTPTGNTEFQFKAGNLDFKSSKYDWLVVSGSRAQYKGEGTINGVGGYGFLLTAIDGQLAGGGGYDKFRIKIWLLDADKTVVYDNQMGADEYTSAATTISGGSIVIHAPKK